MYIPPPDANGMYLSSKLQQKRVEELDRIRREINYWATRQDWRRVPDCDETRMIRRGRLTDAEVGLAWAWLRSPATAQAVAATASTLGG